MDAKAIVLIVVILIIGVVIGTSLTGFAPAGAPAEGQWICTAVDRNTCTKHVSAEEWRNQNCLMDENGTINCQVLLDNGQIALVPLSQLTVADEVCVEWACAVQVWGRVLAAPTEPAE